MAPWCQKQQQWRLGRQLFLRAPLRQPGSQKKCVGQSGRPRGERKHKVNPEGQGYPLMWGETGDPQGAKEKPGRGQGGSHLPQLACCPPDLLHQAHKPPSSPDQACHLPPPQYPRSLLAPPSPLLTFGCCDPRGTSREGEPAFPVPTTTATTLWAGQAPTSKLGDMGMWVSCEGLWPKEELWGS